MDLTIIIPVFCLGVAVAIGFLGVYSIKLLSDK